MSWVPLDARATRHLPQNRQYTELEALFAIQLDYCQGSPATVAGYATQWRWSRDRVRTWLTALGLQIEGQKGRNPGRLGIKSANPQQSHIDQAATSHLMFHNFGRLGDSSRQQPASEPPANPQQLDTPNINTSTSQDYPPTPQKEEKGEGGGEIDLYLQLVVLPVAARKIDPFGYYSSAKSRIEKNGMGERERGQLSAALKSKQLDWSDARRTQRLLASNFSDDYTPSAEALKLWASWKAN